MTDSDIIKALECCGENGEGCLECPFFKKYKNCVKELITLAGICIKRQQAEIERLKAEHDALIRNYKECAMDAVKDFAERIKEVAQDYGHGDAVLLTRYQIDSAVKEMEGKHGK